MPGALMPGTAQTQSSGPRERERVERKRCWYRALVGNRATVQNSNAAEEIYHQASRSAGCWMLLQYHYCGMDSQSGHILQARAYEMLAPCGSIS
jgi:hypothetical protein